MSPPWWHPGDLGARLPYLAARARIQAALRAVFAARGFTEVETPALQISPGIEVHLKVFATDLTDWAGRARQRLYLHTSPEFAMKKLLAGGMTRIHQFARVWRNGEASATHHPEFTMLEWYRAEAGWQAVLQDTIALVRAAATAAGGEMLLRRGDLVTDPFRPWQILTMDEAFRLHAGFDLLACLEDPAAPDPRPLVEAAARLGLHADPEAGFEDWVLRLLAEVIEPRIGRDQVTVLAEWPAPMAALARLKPGDPRVGLRFEAYACGVELCNGFEELTDAAEQAARFAADLDRREALYGERLPVDADFLAALASGLPDPSGNALGFDRLVMLATGAERIGQVLWAPVLGESEQDLLPKP